MERIDPTLEQAAKAAPQDELRLIVRVQGDMDTRQGQLEAAGFIIRRRMRLIHGFGGTASGAALLRALGEEWVISIERDGYVHTMNKDTPR
jgi:hypothetical protein